MNNDRDKHLATILRTISDLHREKAEYLTSWKNRLTVMENQAAALSDEILSGQMTLADSISTNKL